MVANEASIVQALSGFIGLDATTVKEQMLPTLNVISSRVELEDHLRSLLGTGTKQSAFIKSFADLRFPPAPVENRPSASLAPSESAPGSSRRPGNTAQRSSQPSPQLPPQTNLSGLSASFGDGANVYIKNREESFFAGSTGKKGKGPTRGTSTPVSASGSGAATPASGRSSPAIGGGESLSISRASLKQSAPSPEPRSASPAVKIPPVSIPLSAETAEHLEKIDSILERLASVPSTSSKAAPPSNPCFCATRIHPSPLPPLPAVCTRCALVLCSLTPPLGPCPSCAHYPLMSAGLADACRAHFEHESSSLIEKEKRRAAEEARIEREESQRERFPELGGAVKPSHAQRGYATSAGGGPSMDARIAQGFARMEAQSKAIAEARVKEEAKRAGKTEPRTVLRLTKDGKAKIVTTAPASASAVGTEKAAGGKVMVQAKLHGWVDENDDGWMQQKGLEPSIAFPRLGIDQGKAAINPAFKLTYKPPRVYENEGA